ncbi:MAG TPA: basic amino acid ABC transporter substrate-binding protein [Thermotogota bacterium]|nr:basic amino acid ABC transporter substrate-binding protein [Thermotogota bacterium]
MKKFLLVSFLISILLVSGFAGILDTIKQRGTLIIGTNATFPPFEFVNEKNQAVGFDIDLAKVIADALGVELKVEDVQFDGLIPALQVGKFDMVIAGMTITEERRKEVLFSDPYFDAGQVIVVRKGSPKINSLEELNGKKVAVQTGTTGDIMATEAEGLKITRFAHFTEAFLELNLRRVEAVVVDSSTADAYLGYNSALEIGSPVLSAESYGIAIKKGNEELLEFVNGVLEDLHTSPYDKMIEQWF